MCADKRSHQVAKYTSANDRSRDSTHCIQVQSNCAVVLRHVARPNSNTAGPDVTDLQASSRHRRDCIPQLYTDSLRTLHAITTNCAVRVVEVVPCVHESRRTGMSRAKGGLHRLAATTTACWPDLCNAGSQRVFCECCSIHAETIAQKGLCVRVARCTDSAALDGRSSRCLPHLCSLAKIHAS